MDVAQAVKNTLSGFIASGAEKAAIVSAFSEWNGGYTPAFVAPKAAVVSEDAVLSIAQAFYSHFPGMEPSDNPEKFFTDALTAANGNTETVTAIFGIQRQGRERGEWRDESYPAGLTFWFLKNKEHEKLRKQGYAIRKQREEAVSLAEDIGEPPEPPNGYPTMPKVETAAFTPSGNGLDRLNAALGGLKPKAA
jgi:hypothetical protein